MLKAGMRIFLYVVVLSLPHLLHAHSSLTDRSEEKILTDSIVGAGELLAILNQIERRVATTLRGSVTRPGETSSLDSLVHGPLTTAAYILVHAEWNLSPVVVNELAEKLNRQIQNHALNRITTQFLQVRTLIYSRQDGLADLDRWSDFASHHFINTVSPQAKVDHLRRSLARSFLDQQTQEIFLRQYRELFAQRLSGFSDLDSTYDHWDPATVKKVSDNFRNVSFGIGFGKVTENEAFDAHWNRFRALNLTKEGSTTEVVKEILESQFKQILQTPEEYSLEEIEEVLRIVSHRTDRREILSASDTQYYSTDLLRLAEPFVYFDLASISKHILDFNDSEKNRKMRELIARIQNGARQIIVRTGLVSPELLKMTLEIHEELRSSGIGNWQNPDFMPMPFEIALRAIENQVRTGKEPDVQIIRYILLYPIQCSSFCPWANAEWKKTIEKLIPLFEEFDEPFQRKLVSSIKPEIQEIISETYTVRRRVGWFKFKKVSPPTERAKLLRRSLGTAWPDNPLLKADCADSVSRIATD
jgi:hypothetical protein